MILSLIRNNEQKDFSSKFIRLFQQQAISLFIEIPKYQLRKIIISYF